MMNIDQLPREVLLHVFRYFSLSEQHLASLAARFFFDVAKDQFLWKERFFDDFQVAVTSVTDWKNAYKKKVVGKLCDEVVRGAEKWGIEEGCPNLLMSINKLKRVLTTEDVFECERALFSQMFNGQLERLNPIPISPIKGLKPEMFFPHQPDQTLWLFTEGRSSAVVLKLPIDSEDRLMIRYHYLILEFPTNFARALDSTPRYVKMISCFNASRTKVTISALNRKCCIMVPRSSIYFAIRQIFDETLNP